MDTSEADLLDLPHEAPGSGGVWGCEHEDGDDLCGDVRLMGALGGGKRGGSDQGEEDEKG
jgi:hypothetical protein